MEKKVLEWLNSNCGKTFESPRGTIFGTKTQLFEITKVDESRKVVELEFKKKSTPLSLKFWRFETTLDLLEKNRGKMTRLGATIDSDDPNTVEYTIQTRAKQLHPNRKIDYKSAPHICDILVLSGIAEYRKAINPITNRENQAIRLISSTPEAQPSLRPTKTKREAKPRPDNEQSRYRSFIDLQNTLRRKNKITAEEYRQNVKLWRDFPENREILIQQLKTLLD